MNMGSDLSDLRIAVVHEWVDAYAGSEQVFEAIAQEFPTADLYALSVTPGVNLDTAGRPIATTWLNRPGLRDRRALTLPLMPSAWWMLGRRDYDLVISSSHAFAHANRLVRRGGTHISYVHSPARYLWSAEIDERGAMPLLAPAKAALRHFDRRASRHVNAYAANSSAVAGRIKQYWGRESEIIYPPVRVEFFQGHSEITTRDYILGVGRWIGYKNLDLVIQTGEAAGIPVKIAGRGPDKDRLLRLAASAAVPTEVIESPTDEELRDLYAGALCLVFPTVEDFGIVPVEAQAAGTPVVSIRQGGAIDTVLDGTSGALVDELTPEALARGVSACAGLSSADCVLSAERFSRLNFNNRLRQWAQTAADAHTPRTPVLA